MGYRNSDFELQAERLGPLPIINHVLERMGLEKILEKYVPTKDKRCILSHAKALAVLIRTVVVEREPVYRHQETVHSFAANLFGLSPQEEESLTDDRIGRALDRLFDADRSEMITEILVSVARAFDLKFDRLHNDSTSIRFTGQYTAAQGRKIRGQKAPIITYGYSKDHRPDLKQLLFILTTTADGGIPVHFRSADGNCNDNITHIETWEQLRHLAGKSDFLYVADSKLCSRENLDHIDQNKGRFVTVLPRSRSEDKEFRKKIQTNDPTWKLVWDRPHPRRKHAPRDRWWVCKDDLPSKEGWPVIWVKSALLARHQEQSRRDRIQLAVDELTDLKERLANPRSRLKDPAEIERKIRQILRKRRVTKYLQVQIKECEEHRFKQSRPGRPSAEMDYKRITKNRYTLEWSHNEEAIAYDRKSDGMYPLLTNDRKITPKEVLEAHKGQASIEKRFRQCKSVHEIAPVFLKNEGRIEAFFTIYFLSLLLQALIERELRNAMAKNKIAELPLYPEQRPCRKPTTEQLMRLFSHTQGHRLKKGGKLVQIFDPELTPLQKNVLDLLQIPHARFRLSGDRN